MDPAWRSASSLPVAVQMLNRCEDGYKVVSARGNDSHEPPATAGAPEDLSLAVGSCSVLLGSDGVELTCQNRLMPELFDAFTG